MSVAQRRKGQYHIKIRQRKGNIFFYKTCRQFYICADILTPVLYLVMGSIFCTISPRLTNSLRFLAFALICTVPSFGSGIGLADWCVSLNGDINTACNGAGSGGTSTNPNGGSIDLSGFSTVLETLGPPATANNLLGSVVVNLMPGANQFASFYADYDLDFVDFGSFQDQVTIVGSAPSGVSYEAQDPNVTDSYTWPGATGQLLFDDFQSNNLSNTNSVGTASPSPDECCDAAFALSVGGLDVSSPETLTFTVSTTAPTSGFYIQQTNLDEGDSIYLTETVSSVVPEPSTFLFVLGGLAAMLGFRRFRSVIIP